MTAKQTIFYSHSQLFSLAIKRFSEKWVTVVSFLGREQWIRFRFPLGFHLAALVEISTLPCHLKEGEIDCDCSMKLQQDFTGTQRQKAWTVKAGGSSRSIPPPTDALFPLMAWNYVEQSQLVSLKISPIGNDCSIHRLIYFRCLCVSMRNGEAKSK